MNPTQTTLRLMKARNIDACQVIGCENPFVTAFMPKPKPAKLNY